jgi:hypothetical protein
MASGDVHYVQGSDANHLLGRCEECDAHYMSRMTLEQVERWYHRGVLGQDQFEAFMYVWATSAERSQTWDNWARAPEIPSVIRIANRMLDILEPADQARPGRPRQPRGGLWWRQRCAKAAGVDPEALRELAFADREEIIRKGREAIYTQGIDLHQEMTIRAGPTPQPEPLSMELGA